MSAIFIVFFFSLDYFPQGKKQRLDPSFASGCLQELIRLCVQAPLFRNKGTVGDFILVLDGATFVECLRNPNFDLISLKKGTLKRVKKTTWTLKT